MDNLKISYDGKSLTLRRWGRAMIIRPDEIKILQETLGSLICPHCGTTEMLCGYGGVGCTSDKNEED